MAVSSEARWRFAIVVLPAAMALLLLGRVWAHPHFFIGADQYSSERLIRNAWGYFCAPGSAPWAWPAEAPGILNDHVLGLALLMAPWRAIGLDFIPATWATTATTLALNGTLLAVLLRRWSLSAPATAVAAVLTVGLPVFVQRLEHTNNLEFCWLLAWTISLDAWCERPGAWRGMWLAVAGAGLAIMPATVLQWSALCLPVLALITVLQRRPGWRAMVGAGGLMLPALVLGLWVYHPYLSHQYPPDFIITAPWTDVFKPLAPVAWPPGGPHSDQLATPGPVPVLGVIGLVMAIIAGRWRMAAAILLAAVVVNGLCAVTIGSWSPVDDLRGLPLIRGMRSPARFAIPAEMLAVVGVAMFIDVAGRQRLRAALAVAAVALGAQMAVDGGPVVPLRLVGYANPDLSAVSAAAPPGPVIGLPAGILDDTVALATGRVTAGTRIGRPTDWQQGNYANLHMAATLVALHRLGLAGVITDDDLVDPRLAPFLRSIGAQAMPTGNGGLTWWALPPPPAPPVTGWQCTVTIARISGGWRMTITGDPGAPPIEGSVLAHGETWLMAPFLPGTRPISVDLPGDDPPRLHFNRDLPVHWVLDAATAPPTR
jgi:hypothetical protein